MRIGYARVSTDIAASLDHINANSYGGIGLQCRWPANIVWLTFRIRASAGT